jgi:hypothetical protein
MKQKTSQRQPADKRQTLDKCRNSPTVVANDILSRPARLFKLAVLVPLSAFPFATPVEAQVPFANPIGTQNVGCMPELLQLSRETDFTDYQARPTGQPNRCEGNYDPQKSAPPVLELVGYTVILDSFDPAKDDKLQLRWTVPPESANGHLRCYQLQRGGEKIYQMDASVEGRSSFVWPLNIVRLIGLTSGDLGLTGWAAYKTTRKMTDVYLPIEGTRGVTSGAATVRSPQITIMLNRSLRRLTLTVEALNSDLATIATLQKGSELRNVPLTANSPVRLDAKSLGLTKAGFYAVTVGADPYDDAPNFSLPIYIYYEP